MATPRCAGGSVDFNHDRFLNWTSTGSVPKPNRTFVIVLLCHRKVGSDVFLLSCYTYINFEVDSTIPSLCVWDRY